MNEILSLLQFLSSHPDIIGFIQTVLVVSVAAILILPKTIDAWKHLKDHDNSNQTVSEKEKVLLNQISEQVNACSEATQGAVHDISESTNSLLQHTKVLTELLENADIKSLSAMLRKTISDVEGMALINDIHTEKLGHLLGVCSDILRVVVELMELHRDPNSVFATDETEKQLGELKQLINNAIQEILRLK